MPSFDLRRLYMNGQILILKQVWKFANKTWQNPLTSILGGGKI